MIVTSEGEAIMYQGDNPSSATAWAKIGTYFLRKPLGRQCMTQWSADILILTESGVFEMSSAIKSVRMDTRFALSYKIQPTFTLSAQIYGSTPGWQSTVFPGQNALIVNVPVAQGGDCPLNKSEAADE